MLCVIAVLVRVVVNGVHVVVLVSLYTKPCTWIVLLPAVIVPFRVAVVWVIAVAAMV